MQQLHNISVHGPSSAAMTDCTTHVGIMDNWINDVLCMIVKN